jgi:hypothetical protein
MQDSAILNCQNIVCTQFNLSTIYQGRPLILKFMQNVKVAKTTSPTPIYSEKDLLGKWRIASNTYNSTDYYNVNTGAYSSTS